MPLKYESSGSLILSKSSNIFVKWEWVSTDGS
jgi:hypothetical protein